MELPPVSSFDDADPESFYLPGGPSGELVALADTTLAADGLQLPAHSHVLALHSSVLRTLFASRIDARAGTLVGGSKRRLRNHATDQEGRVRLSGCFDDYSGRQVAAFLRFCYAPEKAAAADFSLLGDDLCGVVRLAHHLDATDLLAKLDSYLSSNVASTELVALVAWAQLAEGCQLERLRVRCVRQLAATLVAPSAEQSRNSSCYSSTDYYGGRKTWTEIGRRDRACEALKNEAVSQAVKDVAVLKGLSKEIMLEVLAAAVAGARQGGHVPSDGAMEAALLQS